jgi:FkbM family methyltransferase
MRNGFLRLVVIDGNYEADFFDIADKMLADGGAFFDVGANHGLFSFGLAGRHGDKVDFHLFEPNPLLASSIERTLQLYPHMRCRMNQVAVSDNTGVVGFAIDDQQSGLSHIALDGDGNAECAAITLDDYVAASGLSEVTLMKIDIEGFELLALKGARASLQNRRVRSIYFEYCERVLQRVGEPVEVIDFLDSVGFAACLCHRTDLQLRGGATHTIAPGLPGHGAPLLPLERSAPPSSTDLLAVPREALSRVRSTAST